MATRLSTAIALPLGLFLFLTIPSARAEILGDQVGVEVKLTEEEKVGLLPVLARYYALEGSKDVLNEVLGKSIQCGCRGQCMTEVMDLMTHRMQGKTTSEKAGNEIKEALKAVKGRCVQLGIEPKPEEMGRAVRGMMEAKYKSRESGEMFVGEGAGAR